MVRALRKFSKNPIYETDNLGMHFPEVAQRNSPISSQLGHLSIISSELSRQSSCPLQKAQFGIHLRANSMDKF